MLRETLGIMRELPRLHEIASVFIRHGLGDFGVILQLTHHFDIWLQC